MRFNPQTNRAAFWAMARAMAVYAARAYREQTVDDPFTNASAFITQDGYGDIIVAFKGSSEPRDFMQDAECWRSSLIWSDGMSAEVHHGFLEDFDAIAKDVTVRVRDLMADALRVGTTRAPQVFITGHSLGGALAILCALEFSRQNIPVAGVFTFGQPRVGNAAFARLYNGTVLTGANGGNRDEKLNASVASVASCSTLRDITWRIVNENDIVPRAPGWLFGYRHCGQEVFLQPQPIGGFIVNPTIGDKLLCDLFGLWRAYRRGQDVLILEHFIGAYRDRIKNL